MRAILLVLAASTAGIATGCSQTCHTEVSNSATAQRTGFDGEIDACNTHDYCAPLCADIFKINQADISTCEITKLELSAVSVRVVVNDAARCEAGADDLYLGWGDDEGYEDDDGCDDGSCDSDDSGYQDDSGDDDGSTDTGDDDGGGDDGGGDDDGGDDDAAVHARPTHGHYVLAPYTLAPKLNVVPKR
ncbi:MAG TPA: hypothetical protein VGG28_14935 [Kofleriaceae bacterium]|jgi:hypothetical protein